MGSTPRDPLCEEALRTNRELRERVELLERRLIGSGGDVGRDRRKGSMRAQLTALEREVRECKASPWTYLPWRGYVS